jgi:hypothetical protein
LVPGKLWLGTKPEDIGLSVGRNHVATTLLWNADEPLLPGVVQGEGHAARMTRDACGSKFAWSGRHLLLVDTLTMRFETLRYRRDPDNLLNGNAPSTVEVTALSRPMGGFVPF